MLPPVVLRTQNERYQRPKSVVPMDTDVCSRRVCVCCVRELSSSHLLVSRGIARLLRGEINAARSDLEEVLGGQTGLEEALAANVVSSGLGITKKGETDELFR